MKYAKALSPPPLKSASKCGSKSKCDKIVHAAKTVIKKVVQKKPGCAECKHSEHECFQCGKPICSAHQGPFNSDYDEHFFCKPCHAARYVECRCHYACERLVDTISDPHLKCKHGWFCGESPECLCDVCKPKDEETDEETDSEKDSDDEKSQS
jgi:hypothetical protein